MNNTFLTFFLTISLSISTRILADGPSLYQDSSPNQIHQQSRTKQIQDKQAQLPNEVQTLISTNQQKFGQDQPGDAGHLDHANTSKNVYDPGLDPTIKKHAENQKYEEEASLESNGHCGDGSIDPQTEECDDGNIRDGDGCDRDCASEYFDPEVIVGLVSLPLLIMMIGVLTFCKKVSLEDDDVVEESGKKMIRTT